MHFFSSKQSFFLATLTSSKILNNMKKLSILLLLILSLEVMQAQETDSTGYASGTISMGIVVNKMKKSLEFYKETLGFVETRTFSIDRPLGRQSGLTGGKPFDVTVLKTTDDPNATEFKLLSFKNKPQHPKQKYIQDDNGIQYITLMVNDMKPFLERLKKNRVKTLGKTPIILPDGQYFVLIQDPDGTFIELIGPLSEK